MTKTDKKKRQLVARYDDDLARIREAERRYGARRKYLLGNLVMTLHDRKPKVAQKMIMEMAKLATREHDQAELTQLAHGIPSRSRIILLGALLLNYAERVPSDRRMFDMLRPLARPGDRDILADVFEHHERYRNISDIYDTPEEAAERGVEKAERRQDAVRVLALRIAAKNGFPLPNDDDDSDIEGYLGHESSKPFKHQDDER